MDLNIKSLITKTGSINNEIAAQEWQNKRGRFVVTELDIDDLVPSADNFYSMSDIERLKENIEEFGIQQNLVVMRLKNKKYEIISGHRRHKACQELVKEGKMKFSRVPCRIYGDLSPTLKNIILISTNAEKREETTAEETEAIERLKILYENYKKENPEFKGRVRDRIAKDLGMSHAKVGMHEKISKNLDPELKEEYKAGNITFTAAAELASLSPADQKAVYEKTDGSAAAVKKERKKKEKPMELTEKEKEPVPIAVPNENMPLEHCLIGAREFTQKLASLRLGYSYLEGKIEAVDRAMGPLEIVIKNLNQDIEALEAGFLGEPMFGKKGEK